MARYVLLHPEMERRPTRVIPWERRSDAPQPLVRPPLRGVRRSTPNSGGDAPDGYGDVSGTSRKNAGSTPGKFRRNREASPRRLPVRLSMSSLAPGRNSTSTASRGWPSDRIEEPGAGRGRWGDGRTNLPCRRRGRCRTAAPIVPASRAAPRRGRETRPGSHNRGRTAPPPRRSRSSSDSAKACRSNDPNAPKAVRDPGEPPGTRARFEHTARTNPRSPKRLETRPTTRREAPRRG